MAVSNDYYRRERKTEKHKDTEGWEDEIDRQSPKLDPNPSLRNITEELRHSASATRNQINTY